MDVNEVCEKLKAKIRVLNETLWDNKALEPSIEKWLNNFSTEKEKIHALYLLSKFVYFGAVPMRNLLKSLYRDLYRYPIIKKIREENGDTFDKKNIERIFKEQEKNTRFLGIGNSSESGSHLLYLFRQENALSKELFDSDSVSNDIKHYIFIDDFCGSGSQATTSKIVDSINEIKKKSPDAEVVYLILMATTDGINFISQSGIYDRVESVIELDNTYKCFETGSRIFPDRNDFLFEQDFARDFCYEYGKPLFKSIHQKVGFTGAELERVSHYSALGWGNCQLLLGFEHNTPDNTLPIIWYDEDDLVWFPIFKRYNKILSL